MRGSSLGLLLLLLHAPSLAFAARSKPQASDICDVQLQALVAQ